MNEKEVDLYNQLSKRAERILLCLVGREFYKQVVRLVEWIESQSEFARVISLLNEQKEYEEIDYMDVNAQLRSRVLEVWKDLRIKKIPNDSLGMFAQAAYKELQTMLSGKKYCSGKDGYHYLRMYVEDVARGKYSKYVKEYVEMREGTIAISGEVYQLFLDSSKLATILWKKREDSCWGAWVKLKYLRFLYRDSNTFSQSKSWAKIFNKSEFASYILSFVDFCWDVFSSRYKKTLYFEKNSHEIWGQFCIKDCYLDLGAYGRATIYFPNKAPDKANRVTVSFIEEIVNAGKEGIDKNSLSKITGIRKGDFFQYKQIHNSKLERAFYSGDTKVLAQIYEEVNEKKQTTLRLVVVETERLPIKKQKDL